MVEEVTPTLADLEARVRHHDEAIAEQQRQRAPDADALMTRAFEAYLERTAAERRRAAISGWQRDLNLERAEARR